MQRRFLTNLTFLIFVNLLVKPFWIFGVDRTVQNIVGAEEYGIYFAIFNFSFLFHMILDFGINNFNNRAIARNEKLLPEFLPNIVAAKIGLAFIYSFITLGIAFILQFGNFQFHLLGFLLINQVLISFILYFRSNIAAMHFFRLDALLSVLDRLLMIAIIGHLLWSKWVDASFRIEWLVYGQTGAYAITALIALGVLLIKTGRIKIQIRKVTIRRILKMSFPFALLGVLMSVYNRVDAVMIERLLGSEGATEAGIYAASFRILDALNMIGFAFAAILLPMFARMRKQKKDIQPLLLLGFRTVMVISITIVGGSFFFRHEIMDLLYLDATNYWGNIFGLLIISFLGTATVYIYGSLLTANGNIRMLNYIAIGGVLLNIALNLVLIPSDGALGATIATLATQVLVAGVHIIATNRHFHFNLPFIVLIKLVILAGFTVAVCFIAKSSEINWKLSFLSIMAIIPLFAWGIKLIQIKDWRKELIEN